ncbi:MAG: S9 family peptidase [Asticcacaulis sp.]
MTNQLIKVSVCASLFAFGAFAQPVLAQKSETLAPETRPPLSAYGKLPDIEDVALSPSGTRVALVKDINDQRIIIDHDIATGDNKFASVSKSKIRTLFWGDDDHIILVASQTANLRDFVGGSSEWYTGQILNLRKGKYNAMYRGMEKFNPVVMGNINRIKVRDKYQVTASNVKIESEGFRSLYGFNLDNGRGFLIDEDPHHIHSWVIKPDGELLARSEHDRDTKVWNLRYRQGKSWKSIYSVKEAIDYPSLVGRGRDEQSVLVYKKTGDDGGYYYEVSPDGTFSEAFDFESYQLAPIFHPATRKLAGFAEYNPDGVRYTFYDKVLQKLQGPIDEALEGYKIKRIVSMADDPRKVILYGESAEDAGTYYFVDFITGDFSLVGSRRPHIPAEWIAEQKALTYKAADGLEIHAYLTLPPGRDAKDLPLIVLPHGGPQANDEWGFDWMGQALASRGYAVLQPNFRGSTGYGQSFIDAGHGEWGRKMQTDLSDGVRHLASEGFIDPQKVCIAGASYGGYAALAGVTLDKGVYRCAVSIAGLSNIKAMINWEISEQGGKKNASTILYWKRFLGDEARWNDISPDRFAADVTVPILLIHGKDDTVVPIEQSYRMRDALKKEGKPFEFVMLKEEDHWLSLEPTRLQTLETMVQFLETHNPPY